DAERPAFEVIGRVFLPEFGRGADEDRGGDGDRWRRSAPYPMPGAAIGLDDAGLIGAEGFALGLAVLHGSRDEADAEFGGLHGGIDAGRTLPDPGAEARTMRGHAQL